MVMVSAEILGLTILRTRVHYIKSVMSMPFTGEFLLLHLDTYLLTTASVLS